jgi:CheY-like chemotaxis protein
VKISSEIGAGTSVRLYLPRFVGPEETIEPAAAEPIALATGATTILIVEDEASVRRLGVEALKELGYRVLEADGAAMALRLLDKHPEIALLFTDIAMPEMDGRQLAVEAARRRPGLKILFTTGYTGAQAGMPDPSASVVGKPFTIEQLAAGLRAKLEG